VLQISHAAKLKNSDVAAVSHIAGRIDLLEGIQFHPEEFNTSQVKIAISEQEYSYAFRAVQSVTRTAMKDLGGWVRCLFPS